MQDISGSMANDGKLTAAVEGLSNFITAPSSSGLRLGLGFYPLAKLEIPPLTCTTDADCGAYGPCFTLFGICQGTLQGDFEPDSCEVSDYAQPEVPIAALPGNASALTNALTGKSAVGGSPLTTPLKGAIQYARDWAIANPGFQVAVVLVTDNVPTVCNDTIQGAVQAAQAGLSTSPPVRTFVIKMAGTDGTPEQWNGLAQAGGTSVARTVATSAQMREALEAIRVAASACP